MHGLLLSGTFCSFISASNSTYVNPTRSCMNNAAIISFYRRILSHRVLLYNMIMWRNIFSQLKLPLYAQTLAQRLVSAWDSARPSIPIPLFSPRWSLINTFYRFLIFIYLLQCAFLPFQVLQQNTFGSLLSSAAKSSLSLLLQHHFCIKTLPYNS